MPIKGYKDAIGQSKNDNHYLIEENSTIVIKPPVNPPARWVKVKAWLANVPGVGRQQDLQKAQEKVGAYQDDKRALKERSIACFSRFMTDLKETYSEDQIGMHIKTVSTPLTARVVDAVLTSAEAARQAQLGVNAEKIEAFMRERKDGKASEMDRVFAAFAKEQKEDCADPASKSEEKISQSKKDFVIDYVTKRCRALSGNGRLSVTKDEIEASAIEALSLLAIKGMKDMEETTHDSMLELARLKTTIPEMRAVIRDQICTLSAMAEAAKAEAADTELQEQAAKAPAAKTAEAEKPEAPKIASVPAAKVGPVPSAGEITVPASTISIPENPPTKTGAQPEPPEAYQNSASAVVEKAAQASEAPPDTEEMVQARATAQLDASIAVSLSAAYTQIVLDGKVAEESVAARDSMWKSTLGDSVAGFLIAYVAKTREEALAADPTHKFGEASMHEAALSGMRLYREISQVEGLSSEDVNSLFSGAAAMTSVEAMERNLRQQTIEKFTSKLLDRNAPTSLLSTASARFNRTQKPAIFDAVLDGIARSQTLAVNARRETLQAELGSAADLPALCTALKQRLRENLDAAFAAHAKGLTTITGRFPTPRQRALLKALAEKRRIDETLILAAAGIVSNANSYLGDVVKNVQGGKFEEAIVSLQTIVNRFDALLKDAGVNSAPFWQDGDLSGPEARAELISTFLALTRGMTWTADPANALRALSGSSGQILVQALRQAPDQEKSGEWVRIYTGLVEALDCSANDKASPSEFPFNESFSQEQIEPALTVVKRVLAVVKPKLEANSAVLPEENRGAY